MPKKIEKRRDLYYWPEFTYSFLYLAQLGCQELLNDSLDRYRKPQQIEPYYIRDLYIAIIFNIKHSLELFIKTLGIVAYGEYNDTSHDINSLFEAVEAKIKQIKMEPLNNGYIKDRETGRSGIALVSQAAIDTIPTYLSSLKAIINDFYKLDFIKTELKKCKEINDCKNDIFKYPINKLEKDLDWDLILKDTDKIEIQKLLDYTISIRAITTKILGIFYKYKLDLKYVVGSRSEA